MPVDSPLLNTDTMAVKKSKLVEIKTKPTENRVDDYIRTLPDVQKQNDCFTLCELMAAATGEKAVMWGSSLIGFGNRRYKSPNTGREVDWLIIGFAPRKTSLSLYLSMNIQEHATDLKKLGKHKTGVGCLYVNKLEDVDLNVLKGLIAKAVSRAK